MLCTTGMCESPTMCAHNLNWLTDPFKFLRGGGSFRGKSPAARKAQARSAEGTDEGGCSERRAAALPPLCSVSRGQNLQNWFLEAFLSHS